MMRQLLVTASRSTRLQALITAAPISRGVVKRFVAGSEISDAVRVAGELASQGLYCTIDRLGEDTHSEAQANDTAEAYLKLLDAIGAAGLTKWAEVSIKLSALGQALPDGERLATENARRICQKAAEHQTTVTIDMEDHTTTDSTLGIIAELRRDFPWLGTVLQSQLHRNAGDVAARTDAGTRVRLCKGAYAEGPDVAFTEKEDIDKAYVRDMRVLLEGKGYPMLATHDPRLIEIGQSLITRTGRPLDSVEFQMLLGVRPEEQKRLAQGGYKVRIYVPFGAEWYRYLMRRMAEKPANLLLFLRSLTSTK